MIWLLQVQSDSGGRKREGDRRAFDFTVLSIACLLPHSELTVWSEGVALRLPHLLSIKNAYKLTMCQHVKSLLPP